MLARWSKTSVILLAILAQRWINPGSPGARQMTVDMHKKKETAERGTPPSLRSQELKLGQLTSTTRSSYCSWYTPASVSLFHQSAVSRILAWPVPK